jgi:hypothetical protein
MLKSINFETFLSYSTKSSYHNCRDKYIQVTGSSSQNVKCDNCKTYGTAYDCMSIMHYRGRKVFGGQLIAKDPTTCDLMSPTSHVTKSDKQLINRAYKCNEKKGNGKGKGKGKRKKKRRRRKNKGGSEKKKGRRRRKKKGRRRRKKKGRRRKKKGKRRKKKGGRRRRKKVGSKSKAEMDMIIRKDENLTNFIWVPSEKGKKSWSPGRWKVKDFVHKK